ncbi:MAG TPA: metallophosphoesterase [Candidatus Angelobacter sp.]|nr:metallophosphoesterase [Candidatus Angelobacter sp.]
MTHQPMRIAATADIHFSPQSYDRIREPLSRVRDHADVLVIAGDLTNYGKPEEMHSLLNALVRLRIPIVAVLGNHDYESGQEHELMKLMTAEGIKVLDGSSYERDGVGFAGAKGFVGGFGRGILTAFGEKEIKAFVQASIDETMKLERSLSMLRTQKTVIVTHYAPIADTVKGEPSEIWPYLGSSRLAEVIDRHGAILALHGHAHLGTLDGKTTAGVPVHNVSLTLLMSQEPPCPFRVFEV